jgi:hypothetical protein
MAVPLRVPVVEDSEDDAQFLLRELGRGDYEITHRRADCPAEMQRPSKTTGGYRDLR